MEVIPGTKINLHPLRATSRARFRPSSLSPHCREREREREPSPVRRLLNDTLMLLLPESILHKNKFHPGKGDFKGLILAIGWREQTKRHTEGKGCLTFTFLSQQ